jgi:hypothetical protein
VESGRRAYDGGGLCVFSDEFRLVLGIGRGDPGDIARRGAYVSGTTASDRIDLVVACQWIWEYARRRNLLCQGELQARGHGWAKSRLGRRRDGHRESERAA